MLLSTQIRRRFIEFFVKHHHRATPSSAVVPHNDPTLLFTNAGMNQFKEFFLGQQKPPSARAVSSQKCVRVGGNHNDLENVGHTTRHLTFFEMLGNFSFGDYFKKEAIDFAWDVTTKIFEFDIEKLWVSVYHTDDEAYELWTRYLPPKRIVRIDTDDNFWSMGDTGLCGPCSELFYDKGSAYGEATNPALDQKGERFFEFWNLVFMQYDRLENGELKSLPKPCVDTGAGLERIIALKMGVDNVFETDLLRGLIRICESYFNLKYDEQDKNLKAAFHVIVDHLRTLSFAIADGVQPSNVDRGYVLRKVLRRAVRYGKLLGATKPFLGQLVPQLVEYMGEDFPEIKVAQERIQDILQTEEEAFFKTLKRGGNLLNSVIEKAQSSQKHQISGEDAFKLKDTYGLPLEEIQLVASDLKLSIDLKTYQNLEAKAKELSKSAKAHVSQKVSEDFYPSFIQKKGKTQFVGYQSLKAKVKITGLLKTGQWVGEVTEGQEAEVVLDQTPFYAEMGGQVGDRGTLKVDAQTVAHVLDTQSPYTDLIAHHVRVEKGSLQVGQILQASVDPKRRHAIAKNHTCTHLLHWALCQVVGEHIKQAGSLVQPDRFRFDFSHHKALSMDELTQVENLVNEAILSNQDVSIYEKAYTEVQTDSTIKQFFGDKYADTVRVVDLGDSKELCGGIHARRTGDLGLCKILKESSIAAGVRRIEACTGQEAIKWMREKETLLESVCSALKTTPSKVEERITQFLEDHKKLVEELKNIEKKQHQQEITRLLQTKKNLGQYGAIFSKVDLPSKALREFALQLLNQQEKTIAILGALEGPRVAVVVALSNDLKGEIQAKDVLKELLPCIDGKGGGKDLFAQAGGNKPEGLEKAFKQTETFIAAL